MRGNYNHGVRYNIVLKEPYPWAKGVHMLQTKRKGKWLEIIVPEKWDGMTIDDLFRKIWEAPKKLTYQFRMENKVLLNGNKPNWNLPLIQGNKLMVLLFEDYFGEISPTYQEIPILYEDDHVIVFNKPAFMSTHPNNIELDKDTLLNAALYYLQGKGEFCNIRHIHRLDRDTTGAILFAKHSLAGAILDRMLEQREIKRTYIAIVNGTLSSKRGTIQEPIGRDRHHATKRRVSSTGQEAITHFQVLRVDKAAKHTYVKCWLDTGRTHQIRVHFSHLGHPLAGDVLYGGGSLFKRQALHAAKLEFSHPITGERIICHAPLIDKPPIFRGMNIEEV
jgi:23S rRNA pseudouridine1911/1915/1917 synthase